MRTLAVALLAALVVGASTGTLSPEIGARVAVADSSLEDVRGGVPACWEARSTGAGIRSFATTHDAHTGAVAERLTVRAHRTGGAALVIRMDGGCAPRVRPGRSYLLSAWFHGHGTLRMIANYRGRDGLWHVWARGAPLAPAPAWIRTGFVTPAVPDGARALSFGLELASDGTVVTDDYSLRDAGPAPRSSTPPPARGYFPELVPPGGFTRLPDDDECARRVHRSGWEPRPANRARNHTLIDPAALRASFAARPRAGASGYSPLWDSWLLPRVDGRFAGTTDEIIQWAACKWGLPDNYLRAEAYVESTWFQYSTLPSGRCVEHFGCGDLFSTEPLPARRLYCATLASSGGYDYRRDYGPDACPKTFSIVGVMSWWNPAWGYDWPDDQNGTFPFTRDSTAAALDYFASQIRGCYEGWEWQLGRSYAAGDLWGCAGAWSSGVWHSSLAQTYIAKVQAAIRSTPWLAPAFARQKAPCGAGACSSGG